MTPSELIRNVIFSNHTNRMLFEKTYIVLSNRPFNLKGQEIEEQIAFYIQNHLKSLGYTDSFAYAPQVKKEPDVIYSLDGVSENGFEIKNYGGSNRCQLSTLNKILPNIREYFKDHTDGVLSKVDKMWLIDLISNIENEYTLSSFVLNKANKYDLTLFDFETIDIGLFVNNDFYLKRVGKENRVEILIKIKDNVYIQVAAGANPLNRGIWIQGIKSVSDFECLFDVGYLNNLTECSYELTYDKKLYNSQKAENTQRIIENINLEMSK